MTGGEHLDAAINDAVDLAATIAGEEPAAPVNAEPGGEPALIVRNEDGDVPHDEEEVDRDDEVEALYVLAAGLRDPVNPRDGAFAALARLIPQNMR
jgi:hypothetical protein